MKRQETKWNLEAWLQDNDKKLKACKKIK